MADGTNQAVGLSVGTTMLAAVTADNAVRRAPVLTVGGTPARPVTITDFVDRVGDPVGIIAPDGSTHRAEKVLADALRELAYKASHGQPLPDLTAVAVPAHWRPAAVDALTRALARIPEWSRKHPVVLTDVVAAVTALQADPGLPTRGVIALCDFGGSGTSITLVDAANGYQPIGPTVRDVDFSGDMIDQALLSHVIGELAGAGSVDLTSTSAIGSLWRLRAECRGAKERLSTRTVTAMPVELPEFRGDVRITRVELDDVVREPLAGLLDVLQDTLQRNGIHPADLSAVASVGGGAGIAAVTTTLSEHLRLPVITTPRPALIQATGAALRALRGPADDTATALSRAPMAGMAPATQAAPVAFGAGVVAAAVAPAGPADPLPALAWSEAYDDLDESVPGAAGPGINSLTGARPQLEFEVDDDSALAEEPVVRWYRRPLAVMAASIVVILAAIGGIGVVLVNDSSAEPVSVPAPSVSSTPEAPAPVAQPENNVTAEPAPQPDGAAPAPRTVVATAAPVTRTQVVQQAAPPAPAPAAPEPAPAVTQTVTQTVAPPSEEPAPQQPPAAAEPAPTQAPAPAPSPSPSPAPPVQQWIPTIPPIPTIPGLPPFIPQPQVTIP